MDHISSDSNSRGGKRTLSFGGECLYDIVRTCELGMMCRLVTLELGKWSQEDKEVKAKHS